MQVILLEKMQNLGELGDEVNVKPGFARNFLIPQSKAVPATPQHRAEFEALLEQALAIDTDARPANRLPALLAQERGRRLLADIDALFFDEEVAERNVP